MTDTPAEASSDLGDSWPAARTRRYHQSVGPRWTAERITAALTAWTKETGATPRAEDWSPSREGSTPTKFDLQRERWPSSATVYRFFDSWAAALEAAGLPTDYPALPDMSSEAFSERVARARELADRGLDTGEIAALLGVKRRTVNRYFYASSCVECGNAALKGDRCSGCATRRANPKQWTESELLAAARAWQRETGKFPTHETWMSGNAKWDAEAPRWPTKAAVAITIGGFQEMRLALDRPTYSARWDRDGALAAIDDFVEEFGRLPTRTELKAERRCPSPMVLSKLFGGSHAAFRAAGYEPVPVPRPRKWDRARIIAAIQAFEAANGRPPKRGDWDKAAPDHPVPRTIANEFGSFGAGIDAALGSPERT